MSRLYIEEGKKGGVLCAEIGATIFCQIRHIITRYVNEM